MFADMDTFWAILNNFELFGKIWTNILKEKQENVFKITEKPI